MFPPQERPEVAATDLSGDNALLPVLRKTRSKAVQMVRVTEIRKIAVIGDYLPRKCGIATFTWDLSRAVAGQYPTVDCTVDAVNDVAEGYD